MTAVGEDGTPSAHTVIDVDPVLLRALDLVGLSLGETCGHLTSNDGDVEDPRLTAYRQPRLSNAANDVLSSVRLIVTREPMMLTAARMRIGDDPAHPVRYDSRCGRVGDWGRYCLLSIYETRFSETVATSLPGSRIHDVVRHPVLDFDELVIVEVHQNPGRPIDIEARSMMVERLVRNDDLPMDVIGEVLQRRSDAQEERLSRCN